MSVREYVGARYVPLFADPIQWSNQNTYEPLTIVVNQGASYTSRQFVPVGIDISNTEYWALTGNYNAQIEQYRQEVQQLSEDVEEFDQRITDNTSGIQENESAIETANANISEVEGKLLRAQHKDGIAIAFGDSITRGFGLDNPETQAWPAIVSAFFNNQFFNFAIDGANFSGGTITAQVSTAASDARFSNDNVTMVLVSGGINDHGKSSSNITTGLNNCFNAIKTNFPNADIYFAIGLNAATPLDGINQGDNQYQHAGAISAIIEWAKKQSNIFCFTSAYRWLTGMTAWASDSVHPNELGATAIAVNIINSILGANSEDNLIVRDIALNGDIDVNAGSYFYGVVNGNNGYFTMKINLSTSPTPDNTIMSLPIEFNGRRGQTTIVPFYSAVDTKLAYMTNGVLKPWQTSWTLNTDYYCKEFISVGI